MKLNHEKQHNLRQVSRFVCYVSGSPPPGPPTSSTSNTSNLPTYLEPYVTRNIAGAEAAADEAYQPYQGSQNAGFNANQQAVQGATMAMQTPGQFGIANQATTDVLNNSWTNPGTAQAFMNPYQQNVTDIQKREAARQSDIQGTNTDAQFAKAGAFGGSRQGIVDAERQRNLAQQQNDIQLQGSNQAYQQGMQQYNTQQGQTAAAANQLANLGTSQQQTDMARLGAQAGVGAQQQALEQQDLTTQYNEFLNKRDYAKQQIGWESSILHGTPAASNSNVVTATPGPNGLSQAVGLGIAGLGAYNASQK